MEKQEEKYELYKICGNCGSKTVISLTKIEAAFKLYDSKRIWHETPCVNCGSRKTSSTAMNTPHIDEELLNIWGENPDYFFLEQDEDLILADFDYLPLLLKAFDNNSFSEEKQMVIVNALCALYYNNINFPDKAYADDEITEMEERMKSVLPELQKRKEKILSYKNCIWSYIWEEVEKIL